MLTSYQTWQLLMISFICLIESIERSFSASPSRTGLLLASCETNVARCLAQTCVSGWKKKSGKGLSYTEKMQSNMHAVYQKTWTCCNVTIKLFNTNCLSCEHKQLPVFTLVLNILLLLLQQVFLASLECSTLDKNWPDAKLLNLTEFSC